MKPSKPDDRSDRRWRSPTGEPIACVEKLKVLRENLEEIHQVCQDALDDAVLMGCDEGQFRSVLLKLIATLESAYSSLGASRKPKKVPHR